MRNFIYLFLFMIFIILTMSCTCPPHEPCKSDDECFNDDICFPDGWCEPNPCSNIDCGKGKCNPYKEVSRYEEDESYCECYTNAILYQNTCVPTCKEFSEECSNFNLKNRFYENQLHECNIELGHCDYECQGENSCKYGYLCRETEYFHMSYSSKKNECRKECSVDSDCEPKEICKEESYCIPNLCESFDCKEGECIPNKIFNEEINRDVLCKCNEGAKLNNYGICLNKCETDSDCESKNVCIDNLCKPNSNPY